MDEPKRRDSLVRDSGGDIWRRGNTRWNCLTSVDGVRVFRVGRLPWYALEGMYGPLTILRIGGVPEPKEQT